MIINQCNSKVHLARRDFSNRATDSAWSTVLVAFTLGTRMEMVSTIKIRSALGIHRGKICSSQPPSLGIHSGKTCSSQPPAFYASCIRQKLRRIFRVIMLKAPASVACKYLSPLLNATCWLPRIWYFSHFPTSGHTPKPNSTAPSRPAFGWGLLLQTY